MYYENLHNYVGVEYKLNYYDREKIIITKRHGSPDYSLRWSDLSLWGTFYLGKEFVRYSKIRLYERLPEQFNFIEESDQDCFEKIENYYICKEIGRYVFHFQEKKWIVDVIFPLLKDKNWTEETTNEYFSGITGKKPSWIYDLNEASMGDFLMRIINTIETENKTIDYIVRTLMVHFSSDNREDGLIVAKWGDEYEEGTDPKQWDHTAQIYRNREILGKPVKYGQCWAFAECMTAALRFLGIATRTVFAKNSHINISKNFSIDLFGYSSNEKGFSNEIYYKKIEDIFSFISSTEKSEKTLSGAIYTRKDSMWNIHFWNEIYTPKGWKCMDACPVTETDDSPFQGNKILGPCLVSNIRTGIEEPADFVYLSSSVNSPFRLWAETVVTINGVNQPIKFVHSLLFPFYPEKSIVSRPGSLVINTKFPITLQTKSKNLLDITESYKMCYEKIYELIYRNHPAIFIIISQKLYVNFNTDDDEEYTVQQLCLDSRGIVINAKKTKGKLWEIVPIHIEQGTKFLSFCISSSDKVWPQLISV